MAPTPQRSAAPGKAVAILDLAIRYEARGSVAKASAMRSICSGVWAAPTLQRSRQPPFGAAGGTIRLT